MTGKSRGGKREESVSILDRLFWSVQPPLGVVKGRYYWAENHFAPHFEGDEGYHGVLEVVCQGGVLAMVEFNEVNAVSYYIRQYQGISKRLSDYSFFQAGKARTAVSGVVLVNGITHLEAQMLAENRLTGDFDLLTGASNSIKRSMLPLAQDIAARLETPTRQVYYGIAKHLPGGITPRLQVVLEMDTILSLRYDEIFADTPEEIAEEDLKPFYRQSKYHSTVYVSNVGAGFNTMMDLLTERVLQTQDLLDIEGLPFTGPERRAEEWDRYLDVARALQAEITDDRETGLVF